MRKTLVSVFVVPLLVLGLANPAAASRDEDDEKQRDGRIELLTRETAAVTAGDTAWLALNWTAERGSISDVALVLRKDPGRGVEVTYPTNTATYTGLMNGHFLDVGEIDFTAIRVAVPASFDKKKIELEFEVSYTSGDETRTEKVKVKVPVVQYTDGEHLVIHESAAIVPAGGSVWVDVNITGLAPLVENVKLTASGDLSVVYPSYGSATSLHGDAHLENGETDTARFLVSGADAVPGRYEHEVEVGYTFDGAEYSRTAVVVVDVTA